MTAALYLIPAPLGGPAAVGVPAATMEAVRPLRDFAVENAKSARAYLATLGMPCAIRELNIREIGADAAPLLAPLRAGRSLGVISEAGCPAVADPGADLVAAAHREGFRVIPLVGASAILLALMASGLEGQRFAFCGYLPRDRRERAERIRALERRSHAERETQIFIETPYRSDALLEALLESCEAGTRLCVAADLTLPTEAIATRTIAQWRQARTAIGRRPAVFLLLA
ncbi:MAG TPA: SAM-dependent methyltransferase [Burkholderiales bacterium]|jgi:16S rRNA (cytidine1402-2'-O)-methyltransferase|nr:SAM-dependent methyltransferase [Burkholderiales bacterium]